MQIMDNKILKDKNTNNVLEVEGGSSEADERS